MLSITPSLYSAYYWYAIKDYGTKEDFLRVLRKEPTEPTPSIQAGIDFEDMVHAACEGRYIGKPPEIVEKAADIVRGGIWQPKLGREYKGLWLYGRADVIKCDTIYDIKVCEKYDFNKYQYSIQHWIYSYCTEISKFIYLINEKKKTTEELYFEEYYFDNSAIEDMDAKINDLIGFINNNEEFRTEYERKWHAVFN